MLSVRVDSRKRCLFQLGYFGKKSSNIRNILVPEKSLSFDRNIHSFKQILKVAVLLQLDFFLRRGLARRSVGTIAFDSLGENEVWKIIK